MERIITSAFAGTILVAALGAAALSLLIVRFGIAPTTGTDAWATRRYFYARLTYFTVGASLALTGVLAAVGLSASIRSTAVAGSPSASSPPAQAEARVLETRIRELEATLGELDLRVSRMSLRR